MLSKLPPRERQIVDVLYQRGALARRRNLRCSARQLSGSAVRAMLKRLEDKGFVQRSEFGPRLPLQPGGFGQRRQEVGAERYRQDVFFNGSPASAASALLGMSGPARRKMSSTSSSR